MPARSLGKMFQDISEVCKASHCISGGIPGQSLPGSLTPTRTLLRQEKLAVAAAGFMEVQVLSGLVDVPGVNVEELTAITRLF